MSPTDGDISGYHPRYHPPTVMSLDIISWISPTDNESLDIISWTSTIDSDITGYHSQPEISLDGILNITYRE